MFIKRRQVDFTQQCVYHRYVLKINFFLYMIHFSFVIKNNIPKSIPIRDLLVGKYTSNDLPLNNCLMLASINIYFYVCIYFLYYVCYLCFAYIYTQTQCIYTLLSFHGGKIWTVKCATNICGPYRKQHMNFKFRVGNGSARQENC